MANYEEKRNNLVSRSVETVLVDELVAPQEVMKEFADKETETEEVHKEPPLTLQLPVPPSTTSHKNLPPNSIILMLSDVISLHIFSFII